MRRILFVDDEPNVLQGLQRMLRSERREWEMSFAQGGQAALGMLEAGPCDVVVSDMRMPGMDGALLLAHVREQYPEVIRIILSGHADVQAAYRAVPVAHQFLGKPCDPSTLRVAIERACRLKTLLDDPALRKVAGSMHDLPAVPRTYVALTSTLAESDISLDKVAHVVEQDVAMAAQVLHLVNSAFFGLPREVKNIQTAVSYLGADILKNLVLSLGVFRAFETADLEAGFSIEEFQTHAYLTAKITEAMPDVKYAEGNTASLAALLHDVGKLILASRMPAQFGQILRMARERKCPAWQVEQELSGVTHAELGAYLLGLWGLPWLIVEAVAHHHAPQRVPTQGLDMLATVHIANFLANECAAQAGGGAALIQPDLDPGYIDSLGVADQLPAWRALAREISDSLRSLPLYES
ncbi:MAG TPA: response regulator [Terriglobia bacterium]|nr:response regulator [Terriglobia bacterium]